VSTVEDEKEDGVEENVMEETEVVNSVLRESLFEAKCNILEQECREEEIPLQEAEEKNVKIDYQEMQKEIILSDIDKRTIWEEYKHYVDKLVLNELQDATLCR